MADGTRLKELIDGPPLEAGEAIASEVEALLEEYHDVFAEPTSLPPLKWETWCTSSFNLSGRIQSLSVVISSLQPDSTDPSTELPDVDVEGNFKIIPVVVLDTRVIKRGEKEIPQLRVQWANDGRDSSTWEDAQFMYRKFPILDPRGQGSQNGKDIVMIMEEERGKMVTGGVLSPEFISDTVMAEGKREENGEEKDRVAANLVKMGIGANIVKERIVVGPDGTLEEACSTYLGGERSVD